MKKNANTNSTSTSNNDAADLFGEKAALAEQRAWFNADCEGSVVGIAYATVRRMVQDPNRPGEKKPARSLVVRLTKPAQGKRQDEEVSEVPAGAEIELFVSAALQPLADEVEREPHGVVLARGAKRKTPRGYNVQSWEVKRLPMRLCRGVSPELARELAEGHAAAKQAPAPADEAEGDDTPF